MKLKDVIISEANGEYVAVNIGGEFNGMLKLNDTAAFIAETLQEERSFDEVVAKLREEYEIDEETEEGVEVIGVVWPEHKHKNKIYRYDPNGEILEDGDVVLIPSRDVHSNRDIIRKAAVAHGNHRVDPEMLKHPLKKIIGIVHRASYTESAQTEDVEKDVFEE